MNVKKVLRVAGGAVIGGGLLILAPELLLSAALAADAAGAGAAAGALLTGAGALATVGSTGGAVIGAGVGAAVNKSHDKEALNAKKEGISETAKVYEKKMSDINSEAERKFENLKTAHAAENKANKNIINAQDELIHQMESELKKQ